MTNYFNNIRHGLFGNGKTSTLGTVVKVGQPVQAPIAHPIFGGIKPVFHPPTASPRQLIPGGLHPRTPHLPEMPQ